jgi:putative cell wall-binding protein
MTFLNHPVWEDWDGSPVVAQLKDQDLRRFAISNSGLTLTEVNRILDGQYGRLRAAVAAPDGSLYLTTSNGTNDRVLRVAPGPAIVDRHAGADRYDTASLVSSRTFPSGVPIAYVATGLNYPDALSGGAAAARNGGPVLLVKPNGIPAVTAAELQRLRPHRIVVLGGTSAVSGGVEAALDAYDTGGGVSRLAGADRYATAAEISRATFPMNVPVAYLATGAAYPDALAGVPAAGVGGGPILLVGITSVPRSTEAELARLRPQRIVVLGGSSAISPQVANYVQRYTPTGVQRIAGADRYETAANISARTFGTAVEQVFVATGLNFPDGLTGGAAAAFARGPLLLVPGTTVPQAVANELVRLDPRRVTILGGTNAVTEEVRLQIDALLNQ